MSSDVLDLRDLDRTMVELGGGKAANLGELTRIEGVEVPPGFVVTTEAFRRVVAAAPSFVAAVDRLAAIDGGDRTAVAEQGARVRDAIGALALPADLAAAITDALARLGPPDVAVAVRSSATAEDLPCASFAGLQDSYLNVVGAPAVLEHVRRCWASLFTERAASYRQHQGIDHRQVSMAVVVQRLVDPLASGVLFTADPVSGDRRVVAIDAGFGLGEALVSGLVEPDAFRIRDGRILHREVGTKRVAVQAVPGGGTREEGIDPTQEAQPSLTDARAIELARLGRRVEAHFGCPQDLEWCLVEEGIQVVQSRPITTLFPVPGPQDGANHVYVSVGHQQMMTDPMTPLGLSVWQLKARPVMHEAAGRLFVEVTQALASPAGRTAVLGGLGTSDPLTGDALQTIVDREGFLPPPPEEAPFVPTPDTTTTLATDPSIVAGLIATTEASLAATAAGIDGLAGTALFAFIRRDIEASKQVLFDPASIQVIMAGMGASQWLNAHLHQWLGDRSVADTLSLSVPDNVTSEMGLALLGVADVVRRHPAAVSFLEAVGDEDGFLDRLPAVPGGDEVHDALTAFLAVYGDRCVGEIDLTRPRWSEQPTALVPAVLANVRSFEPGEAERRFARGRAEAEAKGADVLARLRNLPEGEAKAAETAEMIERIRTFVGYREYPKFAMVRRSAVYRRALQREAGRLVQAGVLRHPGDADLLRFEELEEVVRTGRADLDLIDRRRDELRLAQGLTPPRVITSDGEVVRGSYRRNDVPDGALVGLGVSAGTVEGRARVVLAIEDADLEPGDILVTTFTDPGWSAVFTVIAGLVTEVGGLMSHGAVIAREYGLPAIVAVEGATQRIRDGQRIRVHGIEGVVELLD